MKTVKISADEAQSLRKGLMNSAGVLAKGVPTVPDVAKAVKFNKEDRSARFVMSAEEPDRMGDVVVQEGINTENFEANPQALLFHNSRSWPIGKWADVQKNLTGRPKRTEGTMKLLPEGEDPDADRAARHLAFGTMKTVSIGFRVNWDAVEAIRNDKDQFSGLKFFETELLECSLVPIPALPAATMKELSVGMLSPESKELIKGILENYKLDGDDVLDREQLETAVREAEGNKTVHIIDNRSVKTEVERRVEADNTLTITLRDAVKSNTPPDPKDGEEVEKAPDPTEDEQRKEMIAFAKGMGEEMLHIDPKLKATFMRAPDGSVVVLRHLKDGTKTYHLTADELKDEAAPQGANVTGAFGKQFQTMGEELRTHAKGAGKADSMMIKLLKFFRGPMPADEPPVEEEKKEAPIPPKAPDEERRQRAITAAKALQAKPRTLDETDEAA